jgi:hypothetical protein
MRIKKLLVTINITGTILLTACGSGSSSGGSNTNDGGGSLNIQSLSSISSVLGTTYSPYCIYQYGNLTTLVKSDGSGTGVGLNIVTGQITQLSGLPQLNASNGDNCLINFGQLSWYNSNSTSIINIFDPNSNITQTVNLTQTGLSGSTITTTSFALDIGNNQLYANSTFLNDGYVGFSKFNLSVPISAYTQFDNSNYHRTSNAVLFGFMGLGNSFTQMYQADIMNNLPAIIVGTLVQGSNVQQQVLTITDSENNLISAMTSATDVIYTGTSIIVNTGAVQPVLYNCKRSTTIDWNYSCNKTYTDSLLTSKYRIVRLLGANANNLYFLGIDVSHATLNIFSMPL